MLTGGEVLLCDNIIEIINSLKKKKKKTAISTNGMLLSEKASNLYKAKLDSIIISIDGLKETHNKIRNNPELFDKILKGIEILNSLNKKKKHTNIILRYVISNYNYKDIEDFIIQFKGKVDKISFQPVQNNLLMKIKDKNLLFPANKEGEFRALWLDLQKKYKFLNTSYYNFIPDYLFSESTLKSNLKWKCIVQSSICPVVFPDGNVYLCPAHEKSIVGNLLVDDLHNIWKKKNITKLIKQIRKSGCFCWCNYSDIPLYLLKLYNLLNFRN